MEQITVSDVISFLGWILGGAVALKTGGQAILDIIRALKAPNDAQDRRIKDLEDKMVHVELCLDKDNKRFKTLEDGNRVMIMAQLALLDHGLDGNNIKQMEDAKKGINLYLANK